MAKKELKIAMYPWLAMGHLTTFLRISNKLAQKGHQILFILPQNTLSKLIQFNLHPHLIQFIPITVPHVDGLPPGTETTADVNFPVYSLLLHAMDLTEPEIKTLLQKLKPDIVFFDFTHWLPALARTLRIKSLLYFTISPAAVAYLFRDEPAADAYMRPPHGFPPSSIRLYAHEARVIDAINKKGGSETGLKFVQRMIAAAEECDAMGFKSCREMEGPYLDFLEKKFNKSALLAGPVLPEPPNSTLEERWAKWLDQFQPKSVIFCAFGSEARVKKEQFQELLIGIELTGLPFLAALKPPLGSEKLEEALPENFREKTANRGVVEAGWVQQQLILSHPAVGCFVSHCGWGSISEALVNECRMVLMPLTGDQLINARLMGGDLRVGVEVEKGDEREVFGREGVAKAIKSVMEGESEIGREIRANHAKWRDFMLRKGLEDSYIDDFDHNLHCLLDL